MLHICCFGKTFHFFPSSAFPKIDASISLSLASLWAIGDFFRGKLAPARFLAFRFPPNWIWGLLLRSHPAELSRLRPACCYYYPPTANCVKRTSAMTENTLVCLPSCNQHSYNRKSLFNSSIKEREWNGWTAEGEGVAPDGGHRGHQQVSLAGNVATLLTLHNHKEQK